MFEKVVIYLIRVVIGAIFLHHGAEKVFNFELVLEKYEALGFPGLLWVVIGLTEMAAVVALFSDKYASQGALVLVFLITGAIFSVQLPQALRGGLSYLGALERDLLILVTTAFLWAKDRKWTS